MPSHTLHERREQAIPRGLSSLLSIHVREARNSELWDVDGKRYIDFASGISVLNTGHLHEKVRAAVEAQLRRFSHSCFMVTPYETYVELAEKINSLLPGGASKKTLFLNSGAEAVENAVKIARFYTNRAGLVSFVGGFHGRTMMAMALTGKVDPYKTGFGPFPSEVYHVPFPNEYHGITVKDSLEAIDNLFKASIEPDRVAALIVEPVQGEGGFYIAPPDFMQALRATCDEHGIVLIIDEVQTGFGRTGKMFACEHAGIEPDIVTMAKSLGGGFPLSAVAGKASIMDAPDPGGLGGTFGGSPIACAAALAVIKIIEEEDLLERAQEMGVVIVERLRRMAARKSFWCIGDVRGLGAMVAMELVKDRETREPDPGLAKALVQRAAENGLILLSCGTRGNVVRFLPPLTCPQHLVEDGLHIMEASLRELVDEKGERHV